MIRWLVPLGISAFWAVMMGLLAEREIVPMIAELREAAHGPNYENILAAEQSPRITVMGIYMGDRRVGETETRIYRETGLWRITNKTEVAVGLFAVPFARGSGLRAEFEAKVASDYRLLGFELKARFGAAGEPWLTMRGRVAGSTLHVVVIQGEERKEYQLPYDARYPVAPGLSPLLGVPELYVGRRWRLRTLNPFTMQMETSWAEVVAQEKMVVRGEETEVFVVKVSHPSVGTSPFETKIWITEVGEVVKQTAPFGLTLLAERPEDVQRAQPSKPLPVPTAPG